MNSTQKLWFGIIGAATMMFTMSPNVFGEMIILSSARSIYGTATQQQDVTSTNTEILGVFDDDIVRTTAVRDTNQKIVGMVTINTSQRSVITDDQIRGFGRGSGFGTGPGTGVGVAEIAVDFEITETMRYALSGELRFAHGLSLNGSSAYVRLTGPDGVVAEVVMDEDNPPSGVGLVDFESVNRIVGEFSPGVYRLEAFAEGIGSLGATRCSDFDFTLSAVEAAFVPEPSSMSLGLLSLLCLGRRRRRR